ncbi:MAG TPA: hypothetical protein VF550_12370 [Polyangia bacterium]
MSLWPNLAGLFAALVVSATLLLSGCSSSSPRDVNYGTDVGLFYVPPDIPPAADARITSDSADAIDGGALVDGGVVDTVVDGLVDTVVDGLMDAVVDDASIDGNN